MSKRLTVGYRCRIKPDSSWAEHGYANHECILKERSGAEFSVLMLKKGTNVELFRGDGTVVDECAWFTEHADLELVDKEIDTNIRFLDWYEEAEEYKCPDCLHLCMEEFQVDLDRDDDFACPKCDCVFL